MTAHHWILLRTGRWHAWPFRGQRSLCGTATADDLRVTPAKRIAAVLPEGSPMCNSCRRQLALPLGAGEGALTPTTKAWVALIRKHATHVRIQIAEPNIISLALRLATVGPPEQPEAAAAYDQICRLLLTPHPHKRRNGHSVMKITGLKEALAALPPRAEAVLQIAAAVRAWRNITGREISRGERFHADTVIAAILTVPAPEAYIKYLHGQGLTALALMFHPNTLAARKADAGLRGVFGGSNEYWQRTAHQLDAQVVTE